MKQQLKLKVKILLIFCFLLNVISVSAQDSTANTPSINLRYFVNNNSIQYLLVQSRVKAGRKFNPLPKKEIKVYLDSSIAENLIAKTITDETGEAKIILAPAFREKWNNSAKHSFIAILGASAGADEITTTLEITKTKIAIDTVNTDGTRTVNVKLMFLQNNNWVPAPDVEMKIGIDRSGSSILSAGDKETYTTDSAGVATVEFKRENLPGDKFGNFVLAAKIEDNDQYGNVLVEKTVSWGVKTAVDTNFFNQRTLWSTRFQTPLWLLFMAYSIVISVWGTIIYLVWQIVKIKKLGTAA